MYLYLHYLYFYLYGLYLYGMHLYLQDLYCYLYLYDFYLYGRARLIGQNGCDLSECRDYRRRAGDGRITGGLFDYRPPASETIRFTDFYELHQITLLGDSTQLEVEFWKVCRD